MIINSRMPLIESTRRSTIYSKLLLRKSKIRSVVLIFISSFDVPSYLILMIDLFPIAIQISLLK